MADQGESGYRLCTEKSLQACLGQEQHAHEQEQHTIKSIAAHKQALRNVLQENTKYKAVHARGQHNFEQA